MKKPKCPNNKEHKVILNYKYDAYYCELCNVWVEGKCSEYECWACSKRPEKPSLCKEE
ncbi:MAG: hypothetical protein KAS32_11740 [Candidatus Peribacteraceae bacterium]|nr:hypothetical protein [Candidatus Peribacteraceae bacterium]